MGQSPLGQHHHVSQVIHLEYSQKETAPHSGGLFLCVLYYEYESHYLAHFTLNLLQSNSYNYRSLLRATSEQKT